MAATPTTKSQLQAYRFILRRMEHALVRKDAVMLHDPMRTQMRSTAVGVVLGVLIMAGFALVSVFKPADDVSNDIILIGKTSLTTYVAIEDDDGTRVLHPVLNLASARLVAGEPAPVSIVDDTALDELPRGPLLGIPGAPDLLPDPEGRVDPTWTVCDQVGAPTAGTGEVAVPDTAETTTTVLSGPPATGMEVLGPGQALFVRAPNGSQQLIYGGRRAVVDTESPAVTRLLKLSGQTPRPVGAGLLNTLPLNPRLDVPVIPGAGAPPAVAVGTAVVGDVVDVRSPAGVEYYLVLADGVQSVNPLVAQLLITNTDGFVDVTQDLLGPVLNATRAIDLDRFPVRCPS